MERIVVISDAEPDDLIGLRMLLKTFLERKVAAENIFILSTLRNAVESAMILDKIIKPIYPTLFSHIGTSGLKKPFVDQSGLLIDVSSEENKEIGVEQMCKFISSSNDLSVDILLLAPAIDFSSTVIKKISAKKIRSIWSWGGLTLPPSYASSETKDEKEEKESVDSKSASFNWRTATKETIDLLHWIQANKISCHICTPAIYQTTPAWSNFSGVTEENNPVFAKMLRENQDLNLIRIWILQWNTICPEAVKKRCNIGPNSLQFTPADPVAVAAYLWSTEIICSREKISVDGDGYVKRLPSASLDDDDGKSTIYFVNEINYNYFVDHLCKYSS